MTTPTVVFPDTPPPRPYMLMESNGAYPSRPTDAPPGIFYLGPDAPPSDAVDGDVWLTLIT